MGKRLLALLLLVSAAGAAETYRGDISKGEIELLEPVTVFENKWVRFYNDKVRFPNGKEGTYNRISRPRLAEGRVSGAAVLALTEGGDVVLEQVFRHPIRAWTWELPRGGWEKGETLLGTAKRELLEETGFACADWTDLGSMFTDTDLTDYSVQLFLARSCANKAEPTEKNEALRPQLWPRADVERMAADGEIKDSISLAALLRARRHASAPKAPATK
jgi:8-oxo-dGTP pyrophosphatase MutT (NUDIX family)